MRNPQKNLCHWIGRFVLSFGIIFVSWAKAVPLGQIAKCELSSRSVETLEGITDYLSTLNCMNSPQQTSTCSLTIDCSDNLVVVNLKVDYKMLDAWRRYAFTYDDSGRVTQYKLHLTTVDPASDKWTGSGYV